MSDLKAISIMQPWAWLIVNGHKDIENRTWSTTYRGRVLIHAGKKMDTDASDSILQGYHPVTYDGGDDDLPDGLLGSYIDALPEVKNQCGGIVGEAEIVDCVSTSGSLWFVGPYGFVIRNARPLPFRPCRGQLGFFTPDFSLPAAAPIKRDLFNAEAP